MVFDSLAFRRTLGNFATGVTVVSVAADEGVHGMTANSFTSVSLEPPLVLVCVNKANTTHELIRQKGYFGISILTEQQQHVSNWYAGRRDTELDASWSDGTDTKSPILNDALAWFDCRLAHSYDGGDHTIYVGEVLQFHGNSEKQPLIFYRGDYTKLTE